MNNIISKIKDKIFKIYNIVFVRSFNKSKTNNYNRKNNVLIKEINSAMRDKLVLKLAICIVLILTTLNQSFAWFYNEYISNGALFNVGSVEHLVKQYDEDGIYIAEVANPATMIYESNMGVTTQGTKFIEVTNDGTLDMEYDITFQLDGTVGDAGALYYRLYEVTSEVEASVVDETYDTKLKAYAHNNPIPANIEQDTTHPISNLTTIPNLIKRDGIDVEDGATDSNPKYYRLDYGMYDAINSSLYSGHSIAVHASVYSTQVGLLGDGTSSETYLVANETEFRNAINASLSGDTIRLTTDINISGSINFQKIVNLDTDDNKLEITGDLVYDFVETGNMSIDVSGTGLLEVGNDFYLNTPKTEVHLVGASKSYDVYVGNEFTVNGLQEGEAEGILLEGINIVKSKSTYIPVDMKVKSNTRVVIGPEVTLNIIEAKTGATNIEIINNGTINQVQLQNMTLLTTFTKPQIYIYNLGDIYGILGGASIILPSNATPYVSPTQGNTLIVKGVTSSDLTVDGSDNFGEADIGYNDVDESVIPIAGENNAYTIYLKESGNTIEGLLTAYFTQHNYSNIPAAIAAVEKLIIKTVNTQYMDNVDFDFLKSADIPLISYLDMENARVRDASNINKIKDSALSGKTSLTTVILPDTVNEIGANAFYNVELGKIPASPSDPFTFITIPSSVITIGSNAFNSSKYVEFDGLVAPTIATDSFNTADNGAKFFVQEGLVNDFQGTTGLNDSNIFQKGYLSDNRLYFVYNNGSGIGISYYTNETTIYTSLSVPTDLEINSYTETVNAIGDNAYRHIKTDAAGTSITLPSTITKIDAGAFYGLDITSIDLSNVITLEEYSFYDTSLSSIDLSSATTIGNYAFYQTEVETLDLVSIETIGDYAFAESINLYEINFNNIETIGDYAFYDCKNVARVYFSNTDTIMNMSTEEININVGTESLFSNWGYYINERLRVYVPEGNSVEGNKYIDLYKDKFSANSDYIYLNGEDYGSYTYYALPYQLSRYTVREVTIDDCLGTPTTGWEIVSYQGEDLLSTYDIPSSLTVGTTTHDVISIGENAFKNSIVSSGQTVDITGANLLELGDNSLINLGINSIEANNLVSIGDYALSNTDIKTASFDNLSIIGQEGLSNNSNLYELDLGEVKVLGSNSVANNPKLARIYFTNTDLDTLLVGTPFAGSGSTLGSRFRIYVPTGDTYIDYYKSILPNPEYVYGSGTSVGSYTDLNGNEIGEYTIREVTIDNYSGIPTTGWEIIEYHGTNLTNTYQIPTSFTANAITYDVISVGREAYLNVNVSTSNIVDITNSYIINVGKKAFYNKTGLGEITLNVATTIGEEAFGTTDITTFSVPYLNQIDSMALSNIQTLYSVDLGTVTTMASNSLYNLDKLSQVFFEGIDDSLSISSTSITDVGSLTNDRIRFYVTDGDHTSGNPYVDVYKVLFDSSYQDYFYREGSFVGSYNQVNIPYDIGEYTVRAVTIQDHSNNSITGWEIIEYHGTDLYSLYNIPDSVTVGSTTYDIISIGEKAYYFANSTATADILLSSSNVLEIKESAFENVEKITGVAMEEVVTIGNNAFKNNDLVHASFDYLETLGDYAFANNTDLNMINLGLVNDIGDYALYQNASIEQIFFNNTTAAAPVMNITIGTDAFASVATTIGDRVRVYVPDGEAPSTDTYVELYEATLPSNLNSYVYPTGYIAGSYTHSPEPYNIGEYMVKEVTIDGTNGWEIVEYHGEDITSSYTIPSSITTNSITKDVVSIGKNAYKYPEVAVGETWSLPLPSTIIYIDDYAFYQKDIDYLSALNLHYIGEYAFAECSNMVTAVIENTDVIADYAFYLNSSMTTVDIGAGTTSIGDYAFYQPSATNVLSSFTLLQTDPPTIYTNSLPDPSSTVEPIVYVPFSDRKEYTKTNIWKTYTLVGINTPYQGAYNYTVINTDEIEITSYVGTGVNVTIPNIFTIDSTDYNVTSIAEGTFDGNTTIKYLNLPQYLNNVPSDFDGTASKIEEINAHASSTHFKSTNGVLFNYAETTLIAYPNNINSSSYTIPSGVEVIAAEAFKNNTSIDEISFPSSIEVISTGAFDGCTDMRTYNFAGTTPPVLTEFKLIPYYSDMDINVPSAAETTYENNYAFYYYRDRIFGV